MALQIGPYALTSSVILAPMAGVTDLPFRRWCRKYGAGLAVSEMISSRPQLHAHRRTLQRADHRGEPEPRAVQILGVDPREMAACARRNVALGAQIIDINMGCPAKKVCRVSAGSALLKDEAKVAAILEAVVSAVSVPVTLKIRTGWDPANRNAIRVAKIAENCGIQALTIHGRTRACGFGGEAEYETIAGVKSVLTIPVIANGDIGCADKARQVLAKTGADGVMIGRAAQGRPWLFRQINAGLSTGDCDAQPGRREVARVVIGHIRELHEFYGAVQGTRIARKHIGWYCSGLDVAPQHWRPILKENEAAAQLAKLKQLLEEY